MATAFDFNEAQSVKPKGHCIAARVTSEDPDDGFKPTSGKVQVRPSWFCRFTSTIGLVCFCLCGEEFSLMGALFRS